MKTQGIVVSATPCPYWTSVMEEKILSTDQLAEIKSETRNLSAQGFSLVCLIDTGVDTGADKKEYVEIYVYGTGLVDEFNRASYIEVIQPTRHSDGFDRFELSLSEELSEIALTVEGLERKFIKGEVRNVSGMRNTPLLKVRYSRLVDAWLPSELTPVQEVKGVVAKVPLPA